MPFIISSLSFFVQLGQKQQELDRLQKQNNVLKEQLEDALGREQSARAGYVLQVLHSPSCRICMHFKMDNMYESNSNMNFDEEILSIKMFIMVLRFAR